MPPVLRIARATLGARLPRMDGPAKIQGAAVYALEHRPGNLAHAVMVQSTIPAGRVCSIDTAKAEASPGVLMVLTPDNVLPLKSASTWLGTPGPDGPYLPLARNITFNGQHVAAVIAETLEQATAAAGLVKVTYEETHAISSFDDPKTGQGMPLDQMTIEWGDAETALAKIGRAHV